MRSQRLDNQSEKKRIAKRRRYQRLYRQSEKGRIAKQRYKRSKKGKAALWRYNHSTTGRANRRRYRQSRKGRDSRRRFDRCLGIRARSKIAAFWNRPEECMLDLTPKATLYGVRLDTFPCAGPLEIDHMGGGGTREHHNGRRLLFRKILSGRRDINDLRLLCFVHNRLYRPSEPSNSASALEPVT